MSIAYVKTADNGGCGECACHCHSDEPEIPAGHIATCKFADPDYVPPDFQERVTEAMRQTEQGFESWRRHNPSGAS